MQLILSATLPRLFSFSLKEQKPGTEVTQQGRGRDVPGGRVLHKGKPLSGSQRQTKCLLHLSIPFIQQYLAPMFAKERDKHSFSNQESTHSIDRKEETYWSLGKGDFRSIAAYPNKTSEKSPNKRSNSIIKCAKSSTQHNQALPLKQFQWAV